jgi:NAD(P)-dependent dehydrogenase (short-subunit alcohol dehydrogenase family)
MSEGSDRRRPLDEEFEMPSLSAEGRVALVTGGGRGLGLGIALTLAKSGATVAVAARTAEDLDRATSLIEATGARALAIQVDVSRIDEVRRMVHETETKLGGLDILVNCAGVNFRRPVESFTEEDWDRLMAVNLKAAFFASQQAADIMRKKAWGRIINIGSIAFEIVVPNIALYAISKGGMRSLTRAMAVELASEGITVNAIGPGRFWTQMTDAVFSKPDLYDSAVSVIPWDARVFLRILLVRPCFSHLTPGLTLPDRPSTWMVAGSSMEESRRDTRE